MQVYYFKFLCIRSLGIGSLRFQLKLKSRCQLKLKSEALGFSSKIMQVIGRISSL